MTIPLNPAAGGGLMNKAGHWVGWLLDILCETNGQSTTNVTAPACVDIGNNLAQPIISSAAASNSGGTLNAGTYYYRVSAVNYLGETIPGPEVASTPAIVGSTGSVVVTWGAIVGAVSYNVYGRTTGGELKLKNIVAPTVTYTDTNADSPSGAIPTSHYQLLYADYNVTGSTETNMLDGIVAMRDSFRGSIGSTSSSIQTYVQNTLTDMAGKDQNTTMSYTQALLLLYNQMTGVATVKNNTVSTGSQTAFMPSGISVTGNPIIVMSSLNPNGKSLEYMYNEVVQFRVTGDSQSGTATANQEPFAVTGQTNVSFLSFNWPFGSGLSTTLNAVDASQNNDGNTLIQNGDFETFTTTNVPDNWTITVGTVGTNVANGGSSNAYTGLGSLEILGDGSTLTALTQSFGTSPSTTVGAGGTAATLLPETQYAFNCWLKMSSTPAAGTVVFELIDSTNTVINDDQANANQVTQVLTGVSTSWVNVNAVMRTPSVLNANTPFKLRIRCSVAISNTKNLFIDRLAFSPMIQLYTGGPFCRIFSGSTKVNFSGVAPDTWTMTSVNNYAGKLQTQLMWRVLNVAQTLGSNFVMPSSGSPSLSDSLIA